MTNCKTAQVVIFGAFARLCHVCSPVRPSARTIRLPLDGVSLQSDKNNGYFKCGARCGVVVKALSYKPAGRGFDSRWWHNPSGRTMGSTQPLTEMSTRCISWGKGDQCVRLTTLPPSCAVFMKSGNLKFLETSGPLQACNGTAFTLIYW